MIRILIALTVLVLAAIASGVAALYDPDAWIDREIRAHRRERRVPSPIATRRERRHATTSHRAAPTVSR